LLALVGEDRARHFADLADRVRDAFSGRTIWNVNSTATGGGVAELLHGLLPLVRGMGVDTRWLVLAASPVFFRVTKRLHNRIYGLPGDDGELGAAERAVYDATLAAARQELAALVTPGDVVVLHDPQTAGLIQAARDAGARVVWRCHIGCETATETTASGWSFLAHDVMAAHRVVFSRATFAPDWVPRARVCVVPPSLDPFSAKNMPLSDVVVRRILAHVGLIAEKGDSSERPAFRYPDGSPGRVNRCADVLQTGPPPRPDRPLVLQVCRWDRAKDMLGVMTAFADAIPAVDADLLLAGPSVTGVADDPQGASVLQECMTAWRSLPHAARARIHLACLPMGDSRENAVIVNALQRHAAVVTQKSLAEGFGLTVTEAMWKGRPVVASAVGGIRDQIVHGVSGFLVDDPRDGARFVQLVDALLRDPELAARVGTAAQDRVREHFLGDTHLVRWGDLLLTLSDDGSDDRSES
jgi:trehalose synthase